MPDPIKIELVIPQPRAVVSFHVKQIAGEGGGTGPQGPPGADGADGLSAYEIWLAAGNTGDEAAFLLSLKGEQGETGPDGDDGLSAYEIWLAQGNVGDEAAFLASLEGPQGPVGTFDKSLLFRSVITADGTVGTGSSGIIKLGCIPVPANTFGAGWDVLVRSRVRRVSGSLSWSNHVYVNTEDSLSGATLVSIYNSTSTQNYNQQKRDLVIKGATTEVILPSVSLGSDDIVTNVGVSNLSIDWTVDQYIVFAVNSGGIAEQFAHSFGLVEGRRTIS